MKARYTMLMPIQSGSEYITHCRALGFSDAEITQAMKKAGWQDSDIQAAFVLASQATQAPMPHQVANKKSKLVLWIIISAVSLILLAAAAAAIFFVLRS